MADVGVLNLQIHEDSSQAEAGLVKLAGALTAVKNAVNGAMKLTNVAGVIRDLGVAVNQNITDSTLSKLNRLVEAVSKLSGIGKVNISLRGIKDAQNVASNFSNVEQSVSNAATSMGSFKDETSRVAGEVQTVATEAVKATEKAAESFTELGHFVAAKVYNPESGQWDPIVQGASDAANEVKRIFSQEEFLKDKNAFMSPDTPEIFKNAILDKYGLVGKELALTTSNSFEEAQSKAGELYDSLVRVHEMARQLIETLNAPVSINWAQGIDQMMGIGSEVKSAQDSMSAFMQLMQTDTPEAAQVRELNPELQGLCRSAVEAGSGASELTTKLADLDGELKQKKTDTNGTTSAFEDLKAGMQNLLGPLNKLYTQFVRLAKMRMMRYVIREIAAGFKEGVNNVYEYSKAVGGSLAPTMDSLKNTMLQFKNSIGAAVAPLLQSFIPIIQQIVNVAIQAINWLNQLFALLTGQSTWIRATDTAADSMDKVAKAAGGAGKAAKEAKDLLADWDELNIIQSDPTDSSGGGGGGAGKAAADYASMFETVSKFNEQLKAFVDSINEVFGNVLNMVTEIGALLLAWKFSTAFGGLIGTLAGLVGAGIAIHLTYEFTEVFDKTFLKTGEDGWLILSLLTPAVGGVIAQKLLTPIIGGSLASYAIPIAMIFSIAADIKTLMGAVDVSALSLPSLKLAALAAIKGGTAGAYLALLSGGSFAETVFAAVGGALMTFGVVIGLKAIGDVIQNGELTPETIEADFLSAGAIGAGVTLISYAAGTGIKTALTAGGEMALFTAGALIGVQAVIAVAQSGEITPDIIKNDFLSAGLIGSGVFLMAVETGASIPIALTQAGGAALFTAGVLIGLEAIAGTIKTGEITADTIKNDLISAGLIGAGVSLSYIAIHGFSMLALTAGGTAALFTVGALLAIEAIIAAQPKRVAWGDYKATEDEIKAFVENEVFKANPKVDLVLLNEKMNIVKSSDGELKASVDNVMLTVRKITLGYTSNDVLKDLETQLFGNSETGSEGLISKFKSNVKARQETFEVAAKIVLSSTGEGSETANLINTDDEGWGILTQHMDFLGKELSQHLEKAYSDEIDEATRRMEIESITQLSQMIANVAYAITQGEAWGKAQTALLDNLGNLDKGSWKNLMDYIEEYKDGVVQATKDAYDAMISMKSGEVAGLRQSMKNALELAGGDKTDKTYLYYKEAYEQAEAELDEMIRGRNQAIEDARKNAMDPKTVQLMRDTLLPKIDMSGVDMFGGLARMTTDAFINAFQDANNAGQVSETAGAAVESLFRNTIENAFGADAPALLAAIDAGVLRYSDFITKEMADELAKGMGLTGDLKDAWDQFVIDLLGSKEPVKAPVEVEPTFEKQDAGEIYGKVKGGVEQVQEAIGDTVNEAVEDMDPVKLDEPVKAEVEFDLEAAKNKPIDLLSEVAGLGDFENGFRQKIVSKGQLVEGAGDALRGLMDAALENAFGKEGFNLIQEAMKAGKANYGDFFGPEQGQLLADFMGLKNELREKFMTLFNTETGGASLTGVPEAVQSDLAATDEIITGHSFPATNAVDTSATTSATSAMAAAVRSDVMSAINDLDYLSGYVMGMDSPYRQYPISNGGGGGGKIVIQTRATGGYVRSGDLVMANENGNFEMMGQMGGQPVVANNQQIVEGISRGVSQSNAGMEAALGQVVTLMRQMLTKEFSAKVVPSASMGRSNRQSEMAYDRVRG